MSARDDFEHVTTDAFVETYRATNPIFQGLLREVRELSKKKPDATMSASKVKMINRVLNDLLIILKDEPAGKYLDPLDDATLPQMSDALLTMVQFESGLDSLNSRYHKRIHGESFWITEELLNDWDEADAEDDADEDGAAADDDDEEAPDDDDEEAPDGEDDAHDDDADR